MHYVPQFIFDMHEKISDDMLKNKNIAVDTKLIYPAKIEDCPNCIFNSMQGKSSGKYQSGGPIPFSGGICPYCRNKGTIEGEQSDIIPLRVYYDKASWRKIANIEIGNGDAMCIGYIKDMPKVKRAVEIIPSYEIKEYGERKYTLAGEPVPWGLSKDKFCSFVIKRQ